MNETDIHQLYWDVAEVLEYDYTYSYIFPDVGKSNTDNLFALKVRSCSKLFNNKIMIVRPANNGIKRIPLIGELVLICKTFNEQSSKYKRRESWYYVGTVDLQGSINENMLPGLSGEKTQDEIDKTKPGRTFTRKPIAPLQPYEGDTLIEGRLGNSIRFGSTVNISTTDRSVSENNTLVPTYYYVEPTWKSPKPPGDMGPENDPAQPIIVLSNGRKQLANKQFVVENPNVDASSLYLTSNQTIPLTLSKPTSKFNNFQGSQFIGVADKITLSAKTDIIVLDSKKAIILNTPENVFIGSGADDNFEPMAHGQVLQDILQDIIGHLLYTQIKCGDLYGTFFNDNKINAAQEKLNDLISKKYFLKKT
jgi:hypothetical protein